MSTDMEHEIRRCTAYVVGRNCYFAGFAIILLALGFADRPALALDVAGLLNIIMTAVLLLVAINASTRDQRRSEIYVLIRERGFKARPEMAGSLIAHAKRDACLHFARYAGAAAALFLAMGILWAVIYPSSNPTNAKWGITDVPHVLQPQY